MPKLRDVVRMSEQEVESFLDSSLTGVLTTLSKGGWPHSTAMWFVVDAAERRIRMWTYAKSQKAVNLRRDPRCSFLVERGTQYLELKGVLIRARVDIVDGLEDVGRIGKDLYRRYVDSNGGDPRGPALDEIERQARKRVGLTIGLDRVTSWDHAKLGSSPYESPVGREEKA
ncbi:MAG: pyridoxamine 5'-phosphate oxidase family protein [Actinomycetota bacterium]|nr:pyridoxamine 5'-phosphate oxidase family protein [Actinomycetota bacterium]